MDIHPEPLTAEAFAPFGEVIEATGPFRLINDGLCQRHHDRARLDFGTDTTPPGRAGISVFSATPRALPYEFDLIERHPDGSQAFLPLSEHPFLVIVSDGPDAVPRAFLTNGAQGVNLHRGIWHGVLTPLSPPGLFAVVDRIGESRNLEEYRYPRLWRVVEAGFHPAPRSI
ncbi:ureidoglycolate lyase [Pseudogemmobacter bohemicus]|uniref:ureidoglycolate lyase n=1 Tax=Pseudogemmobacter bohemicus TaxID=2250708 RepID=UPI000DD34C83|nr:ureidoglycolate lyase [Pseudogemmobacter bohemicus]